MHIVGVVGKVLSILSGNGRVVAVQAAADSSGLTNPEYDGNAFVAKENTNPV